MGLYCSLTRTELSTRATPDVWNGFAQPYGESYEVHYWHRNHNGVYSHMARVYRERGGADPEFNNKVIDLDEGELLWLARKITEDYVLGYSSYEATRDLGDLLDGIKECLRWLDLGWHIKRLQRCRSRAGFNGTATAGDGGTICILWWDSSKIKYRRLIAEVGENPGIEPGKRYKVEAGAFVECI